MDRNDVEWRGFWPACPTPFRAEDEGLDLESLEALLEFYVGEGVHGVLINGTTGEWFSQSDGERRSVCEKAVAQIDGRVPVIVGCTAYTARHVVALATHALESGADGVAATPPPYSKPYPEEIIAYYEEIARAVDGPLMVYNWPHGTNVDIDADLASRLAEVNNVVALKNSTPDARQFYRTTRAVVDRVRVFGPFMTEEGLAVLQADGGDGTIGGGTLFGRPDPDFWEAYWKGDLESCAAHARRLDRLFPLLWLPGGWGGIYAHYQSQLKALMSMLGQPGGEVRRPRLPLTDPEKLDELRSILQQEGLLSESHRGRLP